MYSVCLMTVKNIYLLMLFFETHIVDWTYNFIKFIQNKQVTVKDKERLSCVSFRAVMERVDGNGVFRVSCTMWLLLFGHV